MSSQCWLINFRSGNLDGARLAEVMKAHVTVVQLDFSQLQDQLRDAARFDRVVVVGGDGTFASILNEAAAESSPLANIPIGLLPIGTANDLAREVGTYGLGRLGAHEELPRIFGDLSERNIAIWELEADGVLHGFCNYVSLGFEGAVVSDFHTWRARSKVQNRILNRAMYTCFGMRHLFSFLPETTIVHDDRTTACASSRGLVISNVQSHMGIGTLCRESSPYDDQIECIRASSPFDYLRMILAKLGVVPSLRAVHRGKEFALEGLPPKTPLQIDGEPKLPVLHGKISVRLKGFARVLTSR